MNDQLLNHLEVFFGDASQAVARIYARLPADELAGCVLTGQVVGPDCLYAKTLPASFRLVDRGPGPTLLAEAIVPDPCFWSPETPFLYRVEIELRHNGELVASTRRVLGIRPLGVRGSQLLWEGKNWVLRGVARELVLNAPFSEWRESMTAMIVETPDDQLLEGTSQEGVIVVATLPRDVAVIHEVGRLARWSSVAMIVVNSRQPVADDIRQLAPNVLFAEWFDDDNARRLRTFAQVAIVDANHHLMSSTAANLGSPTLIIRSETPVFTVAEARRGCDRLQSDLAGCADFAGFLCAQP